MQEHVPLIAGGVDMKQQTSIVWKRLHFQRDCGFFVSSQLLIIKIVFTFHDFHLETNERIATEAPLQKKIL